MQLTVHADYALRVLLYLALVPEGSTSGEISEAYGISRNHVIKVIQRLRDLGYISTTRGRSGGLTLAKPPEAIPVGEVVRQTEPTLNLLECFDPPTNTCPIIGVCGLRTALYEARAAFMNVLDAYRLSDLLVEKEQTLALLKRT